MDQNQDFLVELGVSTPAMDEACADARKAGALGAKLTGSGGGGAIIALVEPPVEPVLSAWKARGLACFVTVVSAPSAP
jgi:mevalonate kinase